MHACTDKALAKYLMREAGVPTPDFRSFAEETLEGLGVATALAELERSPGFPLVVKPARGGSALGVKFAAGAAELPSALVAAFSYDDRVVLERYVKGRDLAVSVLDVEDGSPPAQHPRGAAGSRGDPARAGLLRLRVPLRDRHDHVRVPRRPARRDDRARAGAGAGKRTGCSAATGSRAST